MRILTSGGILLIALAAACAPAYGGPETEFDCFGESGGNSATCTGHNASVQNADNSVADLDGLLSVPAFTEQPQSSVNSDLDSREHPMIPLPPPLGVALILLGGIAIHAIRQQRSVRKS